MRINVQIALALDGQVKEAVLGHVREHVIEEADARGQIVPARAVEAERQVDLGFRGFAAKCCGSGHGRFRSYLASAFNWRIASSTSISPAPGWSGVFTTS